MELRITCEGCFNDLDAEVRPYKNGYAVFLEPCKTCVDLAFVDGQKRGDERLFFDGYAECEQRYKDDIREAVRLTQEVQSEGP